MKKFMGTQIQNLQKINQSICLNICTLFLWLNASYLVGTWVKSKGLKMSRFKGIGRDKFLIVVMDQVYCFYSSSATILHDLHPNFITTPLHFKHNNAALQLSTFLWCLNLYGDNTVGFMVFQNSFLH